MGRRYGPGFGSVVLATFLPPIYFLSRGRIISTLFSITFMVWALFATIAGFPIVWILPVAHGWWGLSRESSADRDSRLAREIANALRNGGGRNRGRRRRR